MNSHLPSPFNHNCLGSNFTLEDALSSFDALKNWPERYRELFKLAAKITPLNEQYRTDENLVEGCESAVWLIHHYNSESKKHYFMADSDSKIVRGLLVLILCSYSNQKTECFAEIDFSASFSALLKRLNFGKYLTPSRSNGLLSVIKKMQTYC